MAIDNIFDMVDEWYPPTKKSTIGQVEIEAKSKSEIVHSSFLFKKQILEDNEKLIEQNKKIIELLEVLVRRQ